MTAQRSATTRHRRAIETKSELQLAAAALGQLGERPKTAARTLLELAT